MKLFLSKTTAAALAFIFFVFPFTPASSYLRMKYIKAIEAEKAKIETVVVSAEEADSKFSEIKKEKTNLFPGVVCWGDSLTAGAGGEGTTYPNTIEALISENIIDKFDFKKYLNASDDSEVNWDDYNLPSVPVINMGIGGERSDTIAGRADAIPLKVEAFTVPEDREAVPIEFSCDEGHVIAPLLQGEKQFNPVAIGDVKGKISFEAIGEGADVSYQYYFTRNTAGEEITVEAGTPIVTASNKKYRDYIQVIMMGGNGGFTSLDELFAQYDAVIARQEKNGEKYIIVGYHGRLGAISEYENFDEIMTERYGDKYVSTLPYLISEKAFEDAEMEITDKDREDIEAGVCPSSFLVDGVHFNSKGYKLIGSLIYERMETLGYFDELKAYLKVE